MTVKIFISKKLFFLKDNSNIYGEIKINDCNTISYYIITTATINKNRKSSAATENEFSTKLRHLGLIVKNGDLEQYIKKDVALIFAYDSHSSHIYLQKLSIKLDAEASINIFLYEEEQILKLQDLEEPTDDPSDDMVLLYQLLKQKQIFMSSSYKTKLNLRTEMLVWRVCSFPFTCVNSLFASCMTTQPLRFIFKRTILYEHYHEWLQFKKSGKRNFNVIFDKLLGICVMALLLLCFTNSGNYLIEGSHLVIAKLRVLLHSLKGSPIGLKLNVQLNSFLLDCFAYHVDLWATFLDLIEPVVRKLFIPIALLGIMGFSYQLASLTDLITIVGLHAHCFSIYSAILYKVEIYGLQVLWKMVLGKRKNLLKDRVESHNYKNRQLYLGTLFFATLLFLFPTILTYYIVFTSLRFCIFSFNLMLKLLRRHLLEFPFEMLARWFFGNFSDTEALRLENFQTHLQSPPRSTTLPKTSTFILHIQPSPLSCVFACKSGVLQELNAKEKNSIKSICQRILHGTF